MLHWQYFGVNYAVDKAVEERTSSEVQLFWAVVRCVTPSTTKGCLLHHLQHESRGVSIYRHHRSDILFECITLNECSCILCCWQFNNCRSRTEIIALASHYAKYPINVERNGSKGKISWTALSRLKRRQVHRYSTSLLIVDRFIQKMYVKHILGFYRAFCR